MTASQNLQPNSIAMPVDVIVGLGKLLRLLLLSALPLRFRFLIARRVMLNTGLISNLARPMQIIDADLLHQTSIWKANALTGISQGGHPTTVAGRCTSKPG